MAMTNGLDLCLVMGVNKGREEIGEHQPLRWVTGGGGLWQKWFRCWWSPLQLDRVATDRHDGVFVNSSLESTQCGPACCIFVPIYFPVRSPNPCLLVPS